MNNNKLSVSVITTYSENMTRVLMTYHGSPRTPITALIVQSATSGTSTSMHGVDVAVVSSYS